MLSPLITKLFFYYYLEEKIKCVDKDSELLDALWKDVHGVNSGDKVAVAFNLQLNQVEGEWLKSTRDLACSARCCFQKYENLRGGRYAFILNKIKPVFDLVEEINQINKSIKGHLEGKKNDSIRIFKSLERQRSKIGNLRVRRVYFDGCPIVRKTEAITSLSRKANQLSTERKDLSCGMESEIQTVKLVIILQAFLNDLHMLQLGSETEKVWVKQAEHMILEAENAIDIFMCGRPNLLRWHSTSGKWIARHKFKDGDEAHASKFLLHQHPWTLEDTDLKDISSAVYTISTGLSKVPPTRKQVIDEIKPLRDQLNHVYNLLNGAVGELLFHSRKLGLEQVKYIAKVAADSKELKTYMEEARPTYLKGIEPIKRSIFLLDRISTVCHIEQNQSSSVVGLEEDVHAVVSQLTTDNETGLIFIQGDVGHRVPSPKREFWINKLREHLGGGRYLLVLDGISSTFDWDMLREVLPQGPIGSNGNRILLTTRYDRESDHIRTYMLTLRNEESDPSKEKLTKEVLGKSGGLPSLILPLAYEKPVTDELSWALERNSQGWVREAWLENLDRNFTVVNQAYNPNATFLPPSLNRGKLYPFSLNEANSFLLEYLSYMRLFPRDFEIPARRLVSLWVAEGLVDADAATNKYKIAMEKLHRLIELNMIQIVEGKFGGKVKSCRLPGALGELILRYKDVRPRYGIDLNRSIPNRLADKSLLSFISTDTREGIKPGEDIRNFLNKGIANECFGNLKVLDLERVFRPQLPKTIGQLIELRYLGLRWTYIEEIPSSIGSLHKLETLDLKHTHVRNLPITIWTMDSLQHLYLDQIYRSVILCEPKTGSLSNLQTLWGAFLDESSPLLKNENQLADSLEQLKSLRKLGLTFQLEPLKQKELANWVAKLRDLERLRLRSINRWGKPQVLHLEPLSGLQKLDSLYLCGKIDNISISIDFPKNLTELTLSATNLQNDPMQDLQLFPLLRSLCLYSDSFVGESNCLLNWSSFPTYSFLENYGS
ncbi:Disease resistance protein [Quillaja saponaria]|uniref:Disease resistance protein n=1 Tax=Quillaja saponaria TaxID=32244 RepID=A0AAD7PQC2_QUISA|nr:Disease resistance protein [Quillaja saponaria]